MHEQSETVQDQVGRWLNIFGQGTANAGSQLPGTSAFASLPQAVGAAQDRSAGSRESFSPMDLQRMYERSYTPPVGATGPRPNTGGRTPTGPGAAYQQRGLQALPQPDAVPQWQKIYQMLMSPVQQTPEKQVRLGSY